MSMPGAVSHHRLARRNRGNAKKKRKKKYRRRRASVEVGHVNASRSSRCAGHIAMEAIVVLMNSRRFIRSPRRRWRAVCQE
jgi:hypothetical protein